MPTIDEKRVYADRSGSEVVLVATDLGVASVSVSADQIGRFGLAHRCTALDAAARAGEAAVATAEGVVVTRDEDEFEDVGYENAVAVGYGDALYAADESGTVAAYADGEWTDLGTVAGDVRAIDGDLVAAADGVYRITGDDLTTAGLDDARDVAAAGPYAATGDGLYRLGNGWMDEVQRATDAVAASADRAHAVVDGTLLERDGDAWRELDTPVSGFVDAAHGRDAVYAATDDGTLAVTVGDGWRSRDVGLRGVRAIAVP